jgi:hypothetical protein
MANGATPYHEERAVLENTEHGHTSIESLQIPLGKERRR